MSLNDIINQAMISVTNINTVALFSLLLIYLFICVHDQQIFEKGCHSEAQNTEAKAAT